MRKNVLIIGNSVKEYALAKKLSENNNVFVAPGCKIMSDFVTCVDIREDSSKELLEYVLENDINLTIPISEKSLDSNIVELFNSNNQSIFAPSQDICKILFDKILIKKLLYKLRIPTPKFGIFEKQNMAYDYIKNIKNPFVMKTNEPSSAVILNSQKTAKNILDSIFAQTGQKVLIEDYVWGTPFSFYVISDGYKALPLTSSIVYKHSLEGDGGQLTSGMGACVPNYKLSLQNEYDIMDNVVQPVLEYLETMDLHYMGILGVNGILTEEGNIQVLGFTPFMQNVDCTAILNLIDIDLVNLIDSCIVGSFSDEYEYIPQKELSATILVAICKNKINNENIVKGTELLNEETFLDFYPTVIKNRFLEYESQYGAVLNLTSFARSITSAKTKVYNEMANLSFDGMYYRKDICKSNTESF
ncbi:hypothetical protein IJ384_06615 [bacterium]|nr:hypothetical protein [bacterium]